jgi:hypothetical protein
MKSKVCLFICSMLVASAAMASTKTFKKPIQFYQYHWSLEHRAHPRFDVSKFTSGYDVVSVYNNGPDEVNVSSSAGGGRPVYSQSLYQITLWPSSFGRANSVVFGIRPTGLSSTSSGTYSVQHYST